MNRHSPAPRTGEIGAVLLSSWLGLAALCGSHLWSVYDPYHANPTLLKAGSWMPGWWGIDPFAGKETAGLALWLGSWVLLHLLLRRRELQLARWTAVYAAGIGLLLLAAWPPVVHAVLGWPPAIP